MAVTGEATSWGEYLKYIQTPLENLMSEHADIQNKIPFDVARAEGRKLLQPVLLRGPKGITHAHTGTVKRTAYTLNPPRSSVVQELEIDGKEYTLQEDIAAGMLQSAVGGNTSDRPVVDQILLAMKTQWQFDLEMELLHGQDATGGIGVVETVTDGANNETDLVITQESWSPALWAEMENALVDIYDDDGDPLRNTALSAYVAAVDPATRTVTIAGTEAELDNVAIGDVIMPAGWYGATIAAATVNCFAGLKAIASHVSGSFLGIDASAYNKWLGNVSDLNGTKATMAAVLKARRLASARGAKGDMEVLINEFAWEDVNNDTAALRVFADDTKSGISLGTKEIEFYSSGGVIKLVPHSLLKCGQIIGYMPKHFKRIGTHEGRMVWPKDDPMHLEDSKAVRFRADWCQGLLPKRGPASCFYIEGVAPESAP